MKREELYLRDDFKLRWKGKDVFAEVAALPGEALRTLEQRKTLAFELGCKRYYAKIHRGVRWREIFKNLIQLRLPVVSASNEWRALKRLAALGIRTPRIAAYGRRGWRPAALESFIITEGVGPHQSLEDLCAKGPAAPPPCSLKRRLLLEIAQISKTMHEHGICHRDYYICHFLLSKDKETLTLIDLHRALIKRQLGRRWIIKDLGSLYFSALTAGLTRRDCYRFMKRYRGKSLRETLQSDGKFWRRVARRAWALHRRHPRQFFSGELAKELFQLDKF